MADSELAQKLARRQQLNEKPSDGEDIDNGNQINSSDNSENECVADGASDELKNRLARRQDINEGLDVPSQKTYFNGQSVYSEFHEFTRKQIKSFQKSFKKYDVNADGFIDFEELKFMMEKLETPQTHLALKEMISEVDEDKDNKINLREFLLIFRKAAAGDFVAESPWSVFANMTAIDVTAEGVGGAKNFFEAKIDLLTRTNAFETEIREEQEERRKEEEEKKERRKNFREKQSLFKSLS